uniref:Ovule protein n=1 Tax=Steinernema glaseri TaxID=37863 RepID=A0A1I8A3J9_9BILA
MDNTANALNSTSIPSKCPESLILTLLVNGTFQNIFFFLMDSWTSVDRVCFYNPRHSSGKESEVGNKDDGSSVYCQKCGSIRS